MAYQIRKISVTNSGQYEGCIDCQTWGEVRAILLSEGSVYSGHGSNILDSNGGVLFNTANFQSALVDRQGRAEADVWGRTRANAVTLREVIACRNNG
ncbi:hypothetical protein ACQUJT_20215 [Ralstonia pseudosolanacearum]